MTKLGQVDTWALFEQTGESSHTQVCSLLSAIDWYQFEKVAAWILELEGWQVERRVGAKADGGADLLARRAGKSAVVQCKYWKHFLITPKTLRELLGTKVNSGFTADYCILFSQSECTEAAKDFAQTNAILVYVAADVIGYIDRHGREQFPELLNPDAKRCPSRDAPMVLCQGHSSFWGCSTYPRCRGKIEISARA